MEKFGIYIHIPFCRSKCYYCNFISHADKKSLIPGYIKALRREIATWSKELLKTGAARTIYIGGGTPTALLPNDLLSIIKAVRTGFHLTGKEEFTVEANPGTVDARLLENLQKAGVNRLSFGVQTFSDTLLINIGRMHTAKEAANAVCMAKEKGFRVSLDLMYNLPEQTIFDLKDSIEKAASLDIGHISIYSLSIEDSTQFSYMKKKGQLKLPTDDEAGDMYDYIQDALAKKGYRRYEIANYAKDGEESRHNLAYWQDRPYIGIGAAAHSYRKGRRSENEPDICRYIDRIKKGRSPQKAETPSTRKTHIEEFSFLALRTAAGINKKHFYATFDCKLQEIYGEVIERLKMAALVEETAKSVRLTARGMKFANRVFLEFLL